MAGIGGAPSADTVAQRAQACWALRPASVPQDAAGSASGSAAPLVASVSLLTPAWHATPLAGCPGLVPASRTGETDPRPTCRPPDSTPPPSACRVPPSQDTSSVAVPRPRPGADRSWQRSSRRRPLAASPHRARPRGGPLGWQGPPASGPTPSPNTCAHGRSPCTAWPATPVRQRRSRRGAPPPRSRRLSAGRSDREAAGSGRAGLAARGRQPRPSPTTWHRRVASQRATDPTLDGAWAPVDTSSQVVPRRSEAN